ncbi:MAG TPA: ABC transporter ATP-binding protein, partial [Ktedonobacteraceae bacterium]|nr:ABC transporter ATP-binding protein [Ktedonobacteraceae bacterium]
SAIIGLSSETHRESILIDRVGRLQLPKEALELYPFHGRAEVRFAEGHIQLWPLERALSKNAENGTLLNNQESVTPDEHM